MNDIKNILFVLLLVTVDELNLYKKKLFRTSCKFDIEKGEFAKRCYEHTHIHTHS